MSSSSFSSSRTARKIKKSAKEIADGKLVQYVKLFVVRSVLWVGRMITIYRRMKECRPAAREEEMSPLLKLEE